MTVTIKPRKLPTLTIKIGDGEYKLPLASGLTVNEATNLATFEGTLALYRKYIPEDVIDALSIDEINQITEAYKQASEAAGADLGK